MSKAPNRHLQLLTSQPTSVDCTRLDDLTLQLLNRMHGKRNRGDVAVDDKMQTNHTDPAQQLKTDRVMVQDVKAEAERLLQEYLDFMSDRNREGIFLDWKVIQITEFKQAASVRVLIDPEKRRYA
jgi:hypothetical protein